MNKTYRKSNSNNGTGNCIGPNTGQNSWELALLAVAAFRLFTASERDVLTGKLFHVPHYRSVFKNVSAPHLPAGGQLKSGGPRGRAR